MERLINDMIHMTEGEKLINYWWLYLLGAIAPFVFFLSISVIKCWRMKK